MPGVERLGLDEALSHIRQTCEQRARPFCFIVGAGISNPPVKLARQMIADFKKEARKRGRYLEPVEDQVIDIYSHWFSQAYLDPSERQTYLRKQIESKQLSHASFRLAHILLNQTIASLVITPNFDDFLSRALHLFGSQPLVYDEPKTFGRINDGREDIQIVHVHGSYRFYDCCNLKAEILDQAQGLAGQPSETATTIESILSRQSPLVIGYSGWEGDVIMTALRRLLGRRLASNLYWFCYKESHIGDLPDWLKRHPNVYFVIASNDVHTDDERTGPQFARRSSGTKETGKVESPVPQSIESSRLFGRKRREPELSAREVFDKFIQNFNIEIPELTSDPLGFFVKQMSGSLPQDDGDEEFADVYSIAAVIDRIQKAKDYEAGQIAQNIESKIESVRNALRASDHAGLIRKASVIDAAQLSDEQRKEIINTLWQAVEELYGDSEQESSAYDQIINAARLLRSSIVDQATRIALAKALVGRGLRLLRQGDTTGAMAAFDEVIKRIRRPSDRQLREALVMALVNKGVSLSAQKRNKQAISIYERVISRFGRSRDAQLQRGLIRALFNKAVNLRELNRDKDALAIYKRIVSRFSKVDDPDIQGLVGAALLNKGYTHGVLSQRNLEIRAYEQIAKSFEQSDDVTLQAFVAKALVNKSIASLRAGNSQEAIRASDDVFGRFRAVNNLALQQLLSKALIVKGDALSAQNRKNDAIKVYETVIYRYSGKPDSVLEQSVAMSMIKKGNQFENIQQATNLYDRVITEFGKSIDQALQEQVATALINSAGRSFIAEDFQDAIELYAEVENRFARLESSSLQSLLATALVNKSAALDKINHYRTAVRTLEKVIRRFSDTTEPSIQEQVASAFFNKLVVLSKLKDWEKAEETYVQMIERYAEPSNEVLQERVINAMLQQSSNFNAADRMDEAIGILDEIFNRFAGSTHTSTQKLVARAMISKGGLLGQMNRHRDAVDIYKVILHRVGKTNGEEANEIRASAFNAIGFQLLCEAKLERSNGHEHSARSKLARAEEKINAALERNPSIQIERALALGNLAYINFLSGNEGKARKLLTEALRIGGTAIRTAELKDTTIHPLDQDKGFRALIRSIG